jgi:quinol monooxygenase YgiN
MSYITLLAKVTAKAGDEARLLPELQAMLEPSRKEPGCLKYVLHRLPESPSVFWFVEEWKSKQALDEHTKTPHYLLFKERTAELVQNVELTLLEPIEVLCDTKRS